MEIRYLNNSINSDDLSSHSNNWRTGGGNLMNGKFYFLI